MTVSPAVRLLCGSGASGDVLGVTWGGLGLPWMPLGGSWEALGPILGALGALLGALGAVLWVMLPQVDFQKKSGWISSRF